MHASQYVLCVITNPADSLLICFGHTGVSGPNPNTLFQSSSQSVVILTSLLRALKSCDNNIF